MIVIVDVPFPDQQGCCSFEGLVARGEWNRTHAAAVEAQVTAALAACAAESALADREWNAANHWHSRQQRVRRSLAERFALRQLPVGFYSAHEPRRSPKDQPHPTLFGWIDHRKR